MKEYKSGLVTIQAADDDVAVVCIALKPREDDVGVSRIVQATGGQLMIAIAELARYFVEAAEEAAKESFGEMFGIAPSFLVGSSVQRLKEIALDTVRAGLDMSTDDVEVEL